MNEDAKRLCKSGQRVMQQLLPFWPASLVDRAKVMLIMLRLHLGMFQQRLVELQERSERIGVSAKP